MNLWSNLLRECKDCLFPIFCIECKIEGSWWCENCIKKNVCIGIFCCPVCHVQNTNGNPCYKCKAVSPLNGVAAFLNYNDNLIIAKLIKQYKYNFAFDIIEVWEKIIDINLLDIISRMNIDMTFFTIIPVPLHNRRERERGFNQSDLIAKLIYQKISTLKKVDFDNKSLVRKKYTTQQAKLNRIDRFNNLKDVFDWSGNKPVPRNILLIDDVYTSGATTQECARVLKKTGAQKVFALTLARD